MDANDSVTRSDFAELKTMVILLSKELNTLFERLPP